VRFDARLCQAARLRLCRDSPVGGLWLRRLQPARDANPDRECHARQAAGSLHDGGRSRIDFTYVTDVADGFARALMSRKQPSDLQYHPRKRAHAFSNSHGSEEALPKAELIEKPPDTSRPTWNAEHREGQAHPRLQTRRSISKPHRTSTSSACVKRGRTRGHEQKRRRNIARLRAEIVRAREFSFMEAICATIHARRFRSVISKAAGLKSERCTIRCPCRAA